MAHYIEPLSLFVGKLTLFNITSTTCDSIFISWETPTEDIIKYRIQIEIQDNSQHIIINGKLYTSGTPFTTSLTEINVTNLIQEDVYRFSISAINSKGIESEESIINITLVPKGNVYYNS